MTFARSNAWTATTTARTVRVFISRREDDLSEDGSLFDQFVSQLRFGQWQHSIDDGFQLAPKHTLHHIEELSMIPHRGTKDLNLTEENLTKIGLRRETRRGTAGEHASTTSCGA